MTRNWTVLKKDTPTSSSTPSRFYHIINRLELCTAEYISGEKVSSDRRDKKKKTLNGDFCQIVLEKNKEMAHLYIQWLSKMINKNASFLLPHRIEVLVYYFTSKNFFSSNFKLHVWITCPC